MQPAERESFGDLSEMGDSYVQTLLSASTECVDAIASLQRIAPQLQLTSGFAADVHTLFYVLGNLETALHHFVDRELLQDQTLMRRREQGAKLEDALARAADRGVLKSSVRASLLAGGIASILHLFALTLQKLNQQFSELLEAERRGDAYAELAGASIAALVLCWSSGGGGCRRRPRVRTLALVAGGVCAARVAQLRLQRRAAAAALTATQERLSLVLHMWGLATSVLQRAHRAKSSSYLELDTMDRDRRASDSMERRNSAGGGFGGASRPASPGNSTGNSTDRCLSVSASSTSPPNGELVSLLAEPPQQQQEQPLGARNGGGGGGGHEADGNGGANGYWGGLRRYPSPHTMLPPSRSYPQLIAQPGVHDLEEEHKQATRALFDTCVPWSGNAVPHAFWWETHPVLSLTRTAINAYYASMLVALRAVKAASRLFAGGEYAVALVLLPWYTCFHRLAAAEVYAIWLKPVISDMQCIYAPLRWPSVVGAVRRLCHSDLHFEEHRVKGVRIVVISKGSLVPPAPHEPTAPGGSAPPAAPPLDRPTVLFVPGGAFIADFEAADMFFLAEWVRRADATVVYVTYEFAPQAPYPTGLEQVLAIYRVLREGTHDAKLGFHASPLVVSGLSAGGNLAVAAMLAPLVRGGVASPSSSKTNLSSRQASATQLAAVDDDELRGALGGALGGGGGGFGGALGGGGEQMADFSNHMPDALLLLCPVLNINRSPSPSRVAFFNDTMLPQPLLQAFAGAYDGGASEQTFFDPLLSPAFAPDEALRRLPPTNLQVRAFAPPSLTPFPESLPSVASRYRR